MTHTKKLAHAALIVVLAGSPHILADDVYVRGFFRGDGTYVAPHYRSAPDGDFYNNWSTKGNTNPYTEEMGERVTRHEQRSEDGITRLSDIYSVAPVTREPPAMVPKAELPILEGILDDGEVARSIRYCSRVYDTSESNECRDRQAATLASIALPDYSSLLHLDASRSARYCEDTHGDNRAGFYHCVNRQYFSSKNPETESSGVPVEEMRIANSYCEHVYGDNRSGYRTCLEHQKRSLREYINPDIGAIPGSEWVRAVRYCERIYDDNRAGAAQCKQYQARTLSKQSSEKPRNVTGSAECERIYGDNRAGFWSCVEQ